MVDFIFVIEDSKSMRGDLRKIPPVVGMLPERAAAAGLDYRVALVRFGTGRIHHGPSFPDVRLDFTTDGPTFRSALISIQKPLTGPTESGSEAIDFSFDHLAIRPNAVPIFILFTDENDDLPVSLEPGRLREPPKQWLTSSRTPQFQARLDEVAQRLIGARARLVLVVNPRNKPTEYQYGAPRLNVLTLSRSLDAAATLSALLTAEMGSSLQGQLLGAGLCSSGVCTQGLTGQACTADIDCALYSRSLDIRNARRGKTKQQFYNDLLDDLLTLGQCQQ